MTTPYAILSVCVAVTACTTLGTQGQIPAPPQADWSPLDDVRYTDQNAAQKAWQPMQGSRPVTLDRTTKTAFLRLPCNFKGTQIDRAGWDRAVQLDLTGCLGIRFHFYCANSEPVSHFSFYFQSGNGWYSTTFAPRGDGRWYEITINKASANIEGQPAGWGQVSTLRVSAWRGEGVDTECAIANLGLVGADAPIVIVRGDSAAQRQPGEVRSIKQFAESVAQCLDELGLAYGMMSDLDLTAERLTKKKLLILPHNPGMPDDVVSQVSAFIDKGGKLLAFYSLAAPLAERIGMKPAKYVRSDVQGSFAAMHTSNDVLPGAPPRVIQRSWNIQTMEPVAGKSRVAAVWHNADGQDTGLPAIVVSERGIHMSHVLLDDDWPNKRQLLLAMVGRFLPEAWQQSVENELERIGRFSTFDNLEEATRHITGLQPGNPAVAEALRSAQTDKAAAADLLSQRDYAAAVRAAQRAQQAAVRAWCLAQPTLKNEHRAFWCHSAFGVEGMTWDAAVRTLASNGFTAVLPNMLWGGAAYYPSNVLPTHPSVAERGDQIALCLAACKKYNVECHVWKVNYNMSGHAPAEFASAMKAAGRTQVSLDGTTRERWLCPSHPDNQKLEIDAMLEVARNYDVDGVHFDYIRYPGPSSCFCPGCRQRFETAIGQAVTSWPDDVRRGGQLEQKWLDFRRQNITTVVAAVAGQARKLHPGIRISAAVFRNYPTDRDGVGQDWKLWCERGYLDFVCPMDYTPSNSAFAHMVSRQLKWSGSVPCYPGIGLSCWPNPSDAVKLVEQILITRKYNTGGFTVFNYSASAAQILPSCALGVTRDR